MKRIYLKLFMGIFCCIFVQTSMMAITEPIQVIEQAGTMNTHDLENLKYFEMEQKVKEDFQNFENRKDKDVKEKEKTKKEKKKAKKAKPENYATEGVYLEHIEVSPSQILTEDEIREIVEEYTQTNVTFEQLMNIVNAINNLYAEKGYVTARAYLPEQTIKNETVKIVLVEGKVGNVNVSDLKWTRPSYVEKRLNLKNGKIFNISNLEQDLVMFNRYNDTIQLKGSLKAGKAEETTDIDLQVEEKLPFHVSILADNQGRPSVGKYRAGIMLQDDSLFGFRDKLTIGSYFSGHSLTPFADYNVPVNKKDGRVGLSYSYGFSQVRRGAYSIFNIESRSHNFSLYYNQPIIRKPWMELSSISSIGYRYSDTRFEKVKLYDTKIPYLQTGLNFRYDTKRGIWYLGQNVSFAFPFMNSDVKYLKVDGGILRLHDFGHGFVGQLRANYQFIPGKDVVPYADQLTAGGMNTVRGYSEGLLIGKDGYIISTELQFPILPRSIKSKDKTKMIPFIGHYLKGFVFWDFAGIFPYKGTGLGSKTAHKDDYFTSLGCGFKIMLPKDLYLRLAWGFPLFRNSHEEKRTWGRFHFDLNLTPDFDYMLKHRKPKGEPVEVVKHPVKEQIHSENTSEFADSNIKEEQIQENKQEFADSNIQEQEKNNNGIINVNLARPQKEQENEDEQVNRNEIRLELLNNE